MIGIIDINAGNLGAIVNIFSFLGVKCCVVKQASELDACSKFILPGVGAFDNVATNMADSGLFSELERQVLQKGKYILGICVGLQILCNGSDEGKMKGFGWFDTQVKKFQADGQIKVPHMGWNTITDAGDVSVFDGILDPFSRFYFLHSYYVEPNSLYKNATTIYSVPFSCAMQKDNILGVQFHPEKSHKYGIHLINNFAKLDS